MDNGSSPATPHDALRAAREALSDAARATAVERQHRLGKLTARERIAALVDHGSFHEVGALVQPKRDTFDTENLQAPADGVLTGYARIDGRPIALCAFDFTVLGGSNGRVGEHKVERVATHCLEHGCPLVLLLDGGGHRIQEGLDSRHFAEGSRYFQIASHLSGWVPTVAVIMGPGFAGPSSSSPRTPRISSRRWPAWAAARWGSSRTSPCIWPARWTPGPARRAPISSRCATPSACRSCTWSTCRVSWWARRPRIPRSLDAARGCCSSSARPACRACRW